MHSKVFDIVTSLIDIIGDETVRLRSASPPADRAEIVAAKARLVAQLDATVVEMGRGDPSELETMSADGRDELMGLFARLQEAATANGEVLRRQIELSTEIMAAVAAEAQRLFGTRAAAYSALGEVWKADGRVPISLNASF